jgi:hypothetical protein
MMDLYVTALVIIAVLTYTIIMSLYMIEKTMRTESLDFTTDEPVCQELQAEVSETTEAEAHETDTPEAEAHDTDTTEVLEADSPDVALDTGENIVVLTPNEKIIVNKLFSHTIGQLLKIRLENERRRKLE